MQQSASTPGPHVVDLLESFLLALEPVAAATAAKMEAAALVIGIVTLFTRQSTAPAAFALAPDSADRWPLLSAAVSGDPADATPRPDLFERVVAGVVRGILDAPSPGDLTDPAST